VEEFERIENPRNADIVVLESSATFANASSASQIHWKVVGEAAERMKVTHMSDLQHDYDDEEGDAHDRPAARIRHLASMIDRQYPGDVR
jgi:hypothetical protein